MQCIKEISISGGKPVILIPLTIVIFINGLKDFLEDLKRKKSDDEENLKICEYFNPKTNMFEKQKWSSIKIGDIVKIKENESFIFCFT